MAVRLRRGRGDGRGRVLEVGDVVSLEATQETFGVAARSGRLARVAALADDRDERRAAGADAVEVRRADDEGVPEECEQQQRGRERRGPAAPVRACKSKSQRSPGPEKTLDSTVRERMLAELYH